MNTMEQKINELIKKLNNEVEFYKMCKASIYYDSPKQEYYEGRISQLQCDIDAIKNLSVSNGM